MRLKIISTIILAGLAMSFSNQSMDDCKTYFPLEEGMQWTYADYDKKDNLTGTQEITVENIAPGEEGIIEYQIKGILDGPKGKEKNHHEQSYNYLCDHGKLKMSMETMIPQEQLEAVKDMEIEITQTEITIPSTLKAGQELPDASINMKVSTNGMKVMDMDVYITNRKVEKFESVTTDAGTYDCAVITYDSEMKMAFVESKSSGKEWISPKVGNVRSEHYKEDGTLSSYRVLTAFSQKN